MKDLQQHSGPSSSSTSFTNSDSEIEVVAGPSKKRGTPTSNPSDEDDPFNLNRAFLATSASRRPRSCSPDEERMRGVTWYTPATTNTCLLDIFLTMIILMVQKKLYYEGHEEAFLYKLEDLFNMEYPMDLNMARDQYKRLHHAFQVEESLRLLIFTARSHVLGDREKGLERLAKFTILSMTFPHQYLKNLSLFDPIKAFNKDIDCIDVSNRLDFVFKPMHRVILKVTCSQNCSYFNPNCGTITDLFQRYDDHYYYLWLNEIKVNRMKDLICDKLDLEDLNKNDFQVRDQHPHVKTLTCKNCKKGPSVPIFIFPKTTWLLRVRWCEVLPFTIIESQKPTTSKKGKGPPPKIVLNPHITDYRTLPNIMELGCTAATQSMSVEHQEKTIWRKSMVRATLRGPQIDHATGIVFSGNQEYWYDGMSKEPHLLNLVENKGYFLDLQDAESRYFDDVTFVRVPPSYSVTTFREENYGRGALHVATMKQSTSPSKKWREEGHEGNVKTTYSPAEFALVTDPGSLRKSPKERIMTAHVTELAARTASASRRLSFNLLKRKQTVALGESDLTSYSDPNTRHSPKARLSPKPSRSQRYSTRLLAKRQKGPKSPTSTNKSDTETSDS